MLSIWTIPKSCYIEHGLTVYLTGKLWIGPNPVHCWTTLQREVKCGSFGEIGL